MWHVPSQYTSVTAMTNTCSIDELTHGGKCPSIIDKRKWVDFKVFTISGSPFKPEQGAL